MKKASIALTILTLAALTYANVFIYQRKSEGFLIAPASLKTIYNVSDVPRITGFRILSKAVVRIKLSDEVKCNKWKVTPDTGGAYSVENRHPEIKALDWRHEYTIAPVGCDAHAGEMKVQLNYMPSSIYEGTGYTTPDAYQLMNSSLPVGKHRTYSLEEWGGFGRTDPEMEEAKKIISVLNIEEMSGTKEKLRAIGKFVLDKMDDKRGVPTNRMERATPLVLYNAVLAGEGGVWCSHFAKVYHLFANAAGVTTRLVVASGKLDGINFSGHSFNESYLPEYDTWAFVDLTSNKLYVENELGAPVSTIELFRAVRNGNYSGLKTEVYDQGEILKVDYRETADSEKLYFNENTVFIFHRIFRKDLASKVQTYLFKPRLAYSENHIGSKHLTKLAFFYGWFACAIVLAALLISSFSRRPPHWRFH